MLLCAGLLAVVATSAEAGMLRFTIEAPGIQTSQVTGHSLTTETFDGFSTGVLTLPQSAALSATTAAAAISKSMTRMFSAAPVRRCPRLQDS